MNTSSILTSESTKIFKSPHPLHPIESDSEKIKQFKPVKLPSFTVPSKVPSKVSSFTVPSKVSSFTSANLTPQKIVLPKLEVSDGRTPGSQLSTSPSLFDKWTESHFFSSLPSSVNDIIKKVESIKDILLKLDDDSNLNFFKRLLQFVNSCSTATPKHISKKKILNENRVNKKYRLISERERYLIWKMRNFREKRAISILVSVYCKNIEGIVDVAYPLGFRMDVALIWLIQNIKYPVYEEAASKLAPHVSFSIHSLLAYKGQLRKSWYNTAKIFIKRKKLEKIPNHVCFRKLYKHDRYNSIIPLLVNGT